MIQLFLAAKQNKGDDFEKEIAMFKSTIVPLIHSTKPSKAVADAGLVKPPRSSFLLYVEARGGTKAVEGDSPQERIKKLGDEWNALPEDEKAKYNQRYQTAMKEFKEFAAANPDKVLMPHRYNGLHVFAYHNRQRIESEVRAKAQQDGVEVAPRMVTNAVLAAWKDLSKSDQKSFSDAAATFQPPTKVSKRRTASGVRRQTTRKFHSNAAAYKLFESCWAPSLAIPQVYHFRLSEYTHDEDLLKAVRRFIKRIVAIDSRAVNVRNDTYIVTCPVMTPSEITETLEDWWFSLSDEQCKEYCDEADAIGANDSLSDDEDLDCNLSTVPVDYDDIHFVEATPAESFVLPDMPSPDQTQIVTKSQGKKRPVTAEPEDAKPKKVVRKSPSVVPDIQPAPKPVAPIVPAVQPTAVQPTPVPVIQPAPKPVSKLAMLSAQPTAVPTQPANEDDIPIPRKSTKTPSTQIFQTANEMLVTASRKQIPTKANRSIPIAQSDPIEDESTDLPPVMRKTPSVPHTLQFNVQTPNIYAPPPPGSRPVFGATKK